jgi:hypothetical protein
MSQHLQANFASASLFGCHRNAVIPTFPEASVQTLATSWWEADSGASITRGRLIKVITPYPDMKPYRLIATGRGDNARQHEVAAYRLEEFRTGDPIGDVSALPVAGFPLRTGETHIVRRGKLRPVLVLATGGAPIPRELRAGSANWQSNQTLLVAPYYGVASDGSRGGWNSEFVRRIQRVEYSQYIWDNLPIGSSDAGSILRLDHVFPVGSDPANWQVTPWRLSSDAMTFVDEWLSWHLTGGLPVGGVLEIARTELPRL